jgi:Flp pilus assembly protein TadD
MDVEQFEIKLALAARSEALLLKLMEKFQHSIEPFIKWTQIAENKRDFVEAIRRAEVLRERFPADPSGYIAGAVALARSGNQDEAEVLLATAIATLGSHYALLHTQAHLAYRAGNADAAAKRFAEVRRLHPGDVDSYVWGAEALALLGRYDEAESLLGEVIEGPLHCNVEVVMVRYARYAVARKDWSEAARRWQLLCERLPMTMSGYTGRAAALAQAGQFIEAAHLKISAKIRIQDCFGHSAP